MNTFNGAALGLAALVSTILAGCTGVPSFAFNPTEPSGPPVDLVLSHIICELGTIPDPRLKKYQFVAALDLNLKVTEVQGIGPSLNIINKAATLTATVGGQLNSTRDRAFDYSFFVDMAKVSPTTGCGAGVAIDGDLGLRESVEAGMHALDLTQNVDLYDTSGPDQAALSDLGARAQVISDLTNAKNTKTLLTPSQVRSLLDDQQNLAKVQPSTGEAAPSQVQQYRRALAALNTKVPENDVEAKAVIQQNLAQTVAGAGTPTPKSSPSSTSKFSTSVDFIVAEALNGGPSWTFKRFKGPGSPLISLSRTGTDTLQVTFTPACNSTIPTNNPHPTNFWETIPSCTTKKADQIHNAAAAGQDQNTRLLLQNLIQSVQPQ